MRVTCTANRVDAIADADVRGRLRRSIHVEGPLADITVGSEYEVQALEERDGGIWLFLHTVFENEYPFPYPAEMFELCDGSIPVGWAIRLQKVAGTVTVRRITFPSWAADESYYERLVDGDTATSANYRLHGAHHDRERLDRRRADDDAEHEPGPGTG